MRSIAKSLELWERAQEVMPGMHSNLRQEEYGFKKPHFILRGKGAHIWDVEGRDYLDCVMGLGPGILGYGNEEYVDALKKQLDSMCFEKSGKPIGFNSHTVLAKNTI